MKLKAEIVANHEDIARWRHDIHAHPELAFDERRTADFAAVKMEQWGIDVTRGVGNTGVVGTLKIGSSTKSIGLRADMDALRMDEQNSFSHKSKYPGRMHACGHDGHTVMLLAAAQYLAQSKNFEGTVQFYFQPAEEANEIGSGAKAMIEDGLFKLFPVDSVFGLHNWAIPSGTVIAQSGPVAASMDLFEVTLTGKGTHCAMPHKGIDTLLVAANLLLAWQSIISRNIDPKAAAVLSATSLQSGESWNVIPETVTLRGSVRSLSLDVQAIIKERFIELTQQIAGAYACDCNINYRHIIPVMVNDDEETAFLAEVAKEVLGDNHVTTVGGPTVMGSDDFAFMSLEKPGCYFLLGNGDGEGSCLVHEPKYDFNDDILPIGASIFARLVERKLPKSI